jgi:hypothetical protein
MPVHMLKAVVIASRDGVALSGKTLRLTSAFCVARAGKALVVHRDHADLRMRALDPLCRACYPGVASAMGLFPGKEVAHHTDWS